MEEIQVRIYSIASSLTHTVIFLEEIAGERILPIAIGPAEGQSIAVRLSGIKLLRPITHDLILSLIESLGAKVKNICITQIKEDTFYAALRLDAAGQLKETDSRPSDAMAIAVRAECPMYVAREVFEKAQCMLKPISEEDVKKFKQELKNLKPGDIFGKTGEAGSQPPGENQ